MPRHHLFLLIVALSLLAIATPAHAQCPDNRLANASFEEGEYKTEGMGTSLSSSVGTGWTPWSVLGGATFNREVEYKVLQAATLPSRYHIHSGNHSQKFFTTWGTHTAGFYQRIAVPRGSKVTFTIWAQIYTGERELTSEDEFISDLDWPTKEGQKRGPGLYRVYAGIDPFGDTPPGFGAPPSERTVWSEPVTDFETRQVLESGQQIDAWVQLAVSAVAQSDFVTVYSKGQPEFAVKHNDSYWDDACLVAVAPPAPTATDTPLPTATPLPSDTPRPTNTPLPTATQTPTATASPSATSTATAVPPSPAPTTPLPPSSTPTVRAEETSVVVTATAATAATDSPEPAATVAPQAPPGSLQKTGLIMVYIGAAVLAIIAVIWLRMGDKS